MPPEVAISRTVPGAPLIIQPNPVRAYLPKQFWARDAEYFVYSCEWNTLALSAQGQADSFAIANDVDFLVLGVSVIEATAAAGTAEQAFWPVLVMISESGTGNKWFDSLQQLHNVAGRGNVDGLGYRPLVYPRFIQGGTEVNVELTNLEATARRVWMSFHGCKIYRARVS